MTEVEKFCLPHIPASPAFEIERGLVGGAAYDAHGKSISESDMKLALAATPSCSAPSAARNGTGGLTKCGPKRACCAFARIRPVRQPATGDLLSGAR